ncbi:MAG: 50S ribosomal protein L30 [Clostridiales bacterium]|jgi:large subunit ribosomal protein L30|nr:50S ribosomal protein L30 [Clostridiales bacterium]
MVKITLVRSLIGSKPAHKATAASLGLHKIGDFIVLEDNDATRGKIKAIEHLVRVENV